MRKKVKLKNFKHEELACLLEMLFCLLLFVELYNFPFKVNVIEMSICLIEQWIAEKQSLLSSRSFINKSFQLVVFIGTGKCLQSLRLDLIFGGPII